MTNIETKQDMIQALFNRGEYIKQVSDVEYRTRCPFCGDSQKNFNTGHLYIRINVEDNFPMVYNCFKCNEHGIINQEFLNIMDIDDINLKSSITALNKTADKVKAHKFINGDKTIIFNYERPEVKRCKKIEYLENRLGVKFNNNDIEKMKIITSLREFLILNDIRSITCDNRWAHKIEDHYVGFLTFGGSHILFRDITETEEYRWIKYPITQESKQCRAFYSMESEIDIFTKDKLIINLSEGILDIVSAYINLGYSEPNTMNIAVCGKHYVSILLKLVNMGFVGDNIILNIFADNDKDFNNKNNNPTTIEFFRNNLHKMKYLYGEVNIYYNTISKDIGVPRQEISLKKYRL